VCRQVYRWDPAAGGGAGDWAGPVEDRRYVYDGWNVLVELDGLDYDEDGWPDNLVVRWLTWGLDLAGQAGDAEQSRDREGAVGGLASAGGVASGGAIPGLQGAGGIGGLLAADDANGTPGVTGDDEQYVFFYDAQGNVGQLVKDAVQPLARYEYDAYGRTIGPDADGDGDWTDDAGPFATTNAYRFSTKPCDGALTYSEPAAPGLYYYGYRYYSPRLGRWLSREPLGEDASPNLYAFANNAPLNWMDPDGLRTEPSQPSSQPNPTSQPEATTQPRHRRQRRTSEPKHPAHVTIAKCDDRQSKKALSDSRKACGCAAKLRDFFGSRAAVEEAVRSDPNRAFLRAWYLAEQDPSHRHKLEKLNEDRQELARVYGLIAEKCSRGFVVQCECERCGKDTYAYVPKLFGWYYGNTIYVCPLYFTDGQWGTIMHELSHKAAGTDDDSASWSENAHLVESVAKSLCDIVDQ